MRGKVTTRRGMRRLGSALIATGLLSAGLIASAAGASASTASARSFFSFEVFLSNHTGCDLVLVTARLDHGEWSRRPPARIKSGRLVSWESESNGVATGTEGEADYITENCDPSSNNTKRIHAHWDNPAFGSNSGDAAGTDPAFRTNVVIGGGHHAGGQFTYFLPE
ncbi:hypothetical protein [Nonomuraea sp. NPDC048901]|uniref:hypothetical protein n=1 Tax=Nonomuraea sp. NPDC048901 TaxID=3155627 RepID=UPI0033C25DA8